MNIYLGIKKINYILFSILLIYSKKKKTEIEEESPAEVVGPFYGPAASCHELGRLGYTLNGLYLLLGKDSNLNNKKKNIQIVQCEFRRPQQESQSNLLKELFHHHK